MIGSNRFCHFGGWSDPESSRRRTKQQRGSRAEEGESWVARPARVEDFDAWDELFAGYCDFYERPSTPEHRRLVWSWIGAGTIHCLVAVPADPATPPTDPGEARAVGLAHVRPMPSPLRGATSGFLDDLFIAPAARGAGAFECLIAAIRDLAAAEGWPNVRWITAADNLRARSAYDRVATKTDWVTYQLDV
jgi:GNAT superfamily N-acetyltransferase